MKNSIRHDVVVNMPYKLTHFLIKNKSYTQFINNVIDFALDWSIRKEHLLNNLKTINPFCKAFRWVDTPERHAHWRNLCIKYEQETRDCKMA